MPWRRNVCLRVHIPDLCPFPKGVGESWSDEIAVVRKIDFHLISSLFLLFVFNILDRSNIANARIGGMQKDLGLNDTQYQTAVAIMVSSPRRLVEYHARSTLDSIRTSI